ncbi:hypothetical protein RIR_jg17951.t1 [Rhizophagus irregularis DAOM 181602=DAOM 197198]|nr:hypothetical protein RIR_jg17951.t1 [Rhizophagus irregularis DAOM 181602=DAOM 197198]
MLATSKTKILRPELYDRHRNFLFWNTCETKSAHFLREAKFPFLEVCVTSRDNWPMGEMLHKYLGFGMGFGIWDGMGFGIGIWDGMGYGMGGEGMGGDGRGF